MLHSALFTVGPFHAWCERMHSALGGPVFYTCRNFKEQEQFRVIREEKSEEEDVANVPLERHRTKVLPNVMKS